MSPLQALNKLKAVREKLADARPFYEEARPPLQDLAKKVLSDTLQNLRPETVEPESWRAEVALLAASVVAELVDDVEAPGLALGVSSERGAHVDPVTGEAGISIDEAEAWVAAGRNKGSAEELGKNLDQRDEDKTDRQIAWRIVASVNKGNSRLEERIKAFAGLAAGAGAGAMLDQVMIAWTANLVPEAQKRWGEWIGRNARN